MTIKEANAIDMVAYLSVAGIEPAKVKGENYWYHSPLRTEKVPSFKVNRRRNQWFDFGEGKGGNLLDFILLYENLSISEAFNQLEQASSLSVSSSDNWPSAESGIEILSAHNIVSSPLIRYYQSRRISGIVAEKHLCEVHYTNNGKSYYALGFKNDLGGYELRNAYFKGSCSPKAVTHVKTDGYSLAVFEGVFDFLSFLTIHLGQINPPLDYLVLNSTAFFEMQLPKMQAYSQILLFLDNDRTGNRCTDLALATDPVKFRDERALFAGHKDLSDWHQNFGSGAGPAAQAR